MPEHEFLRPLQLVADLRIDLSSERGDASGHLHGDNDGLVLDVDNPAALLSQLRGQELPLQAVQQLIPQTPVSVRSNGRKLARLRLTSAGKIRVRPTPAGLVTGAKIALADPRGRLVAVTAVALAVATIGSRLTRAGQSRHQ